MKQASRGRAGNRVLLRFERGQQGQDGDDGEAVISRQRLHWKAQRARSPEGSLIILWKSCRRADSEVDQLSMTPVRGTIFEFAAQLQRDLGTARGQKGEKRPQRVRIIVAPPKSGEAIYRHGAGATRRTTAWASSTSSSPRSLSAKPKAPSADMRLHRSWFGDPQWKTNGTPGANCWAMRNAPKPSNPGIALSDTIMWGGRRARDDIIVGWQCATSQVKSIPAWTRRQQAISTSGRLSSTKRIWMLRLSSTLAGGETCSTMHSGYLAWITGEIARNAHPRSECAASVWHRRPAGGACQRSACKPITWPARTHCSRSWRPSCSSKPRAFSRAA